MNERYKLGWNDACRQEIWPAWQVLQQCYLYFINPETIPQDVDTSSWHYMKGRMEAAIAYVRNGKWEEIE